MLQLPLNVQLDSDAEFENYFAGENLQVVSRLKSVDLLESEFIYCWGAKGCGKSHLAQALCKNASEAGALVAYLPLNHPDFEPSILQGLEYADLICLDSIESIVENMNWEEALFHLFNLIKSKQKNLVIFAQNSPNTSSFQLADLRSRLNAMEIYKIEQLRQEDKDLFVIQYAKNRGLELSKEVVTYILTRAQREISDLIRLIDRLDNESLAHQRKITIPFIKSLLGW